MSREWEELTYSIGDSEENKDNFPKGNMILSYRWECSETG